MRILVHHIPLVASFCLTSACRAPDICSCEMTQFLSVSPTSLLDSATVGSTTPRVMTIEVMNEGGGELRWRAMIKHASPWLSMAPDTGTAGMTPAPQLQANPTGLAVGSYRDTVVVEDISGTGSLQVPVELRIHQ